MTTTTRVPGDRFRGDEYQCRRCGRINACNPGDKPLTCRACELPARVETTFPDQGWAVDALCAQVDTELFFPTKGGAYLRAKAVCAACPVTAACRAWALAVKPEFGVWGGMSAAERRRLDGGEVA